MKNKKNIERLFQESFKDFEVKPNDAVWENLQSKLAHKEQTKKKPIPVWYKYAGIAALLLLFLVIGYAIITSGNSKDTNTIVDTKTDDKSSPDTDIDFNTEAFQPESILKDESGFENAANNDAVASSEDSSNENNLIDDTSSEEKTANGSATPNSLKVNKTYKNNSNSSVVKNTQEKQHNNKITENTSVASTLNPSENTNSDNSNANNLKKKSTLNSRTDKNNALTYSNSENKETIASTKSSENENKNSSEGGKDKLNDINISTQLTPVLTQNNSKENNLDSRNEEERINTTHADLINAIIKSDSLLLADAIAKTEDSIEKEKEVNRWQVYASIAPVYYNTMGKGSHIHEQFNNNKKNGEINTSYGVNVGYAINDKITIRTGVNSLNLSYDTANVILYENISGSNSSVNEYRNIDFNPVVGDSLNIISSATLQVQQVNPSLGSSFDTAISQRISFLEVPVEIQYDIIESKFNLQLIGGFSTFFLNDNEIYAEIDNRRNYIGKANNINDVSFSTNFGIGLGFNFSEAFQFNFEPTLKYQLNAFNNTSGNFKPYILGVYTGIKYSF